VTRAVEGAPGLSKTDRLEAFSDGVFAIAITLLVFNIKVPEAGSQGGLVRALAGLWPSYLGYGISFVTLGIMWANHHAMFAYIARADRYFLLLHVFFLMFIAFLPFPTAVLAKHLPYPDTRRTAVAFYSAVLVVIALAYNAVWWYAIAGRRLLDARADPEAVRTITRRYAMGPFSYLVSFGLAFVNVWASLAVHGVLMILYLLPERQLRAES
jgi:TMEM175 potassium channel family protein